jgi:hypothetical protein
MTTSLFCSPFFESKGQGVGFPTAESRFHSPTYSAAAQIGNGRNIPSMIGTRNHKIYWFPVLKVVE